MKEFSPVAAVAITLSLITSCGPSDEPLALLSLDGVVLEPAYEVLPDQFGGTVGVGAFSLSPDGVLAILDPFSPGVILYDRHAEDTLRIGRTGEGPGEFRSARAVTFLDEERFAVFDRALGRLSIWRLPASHITDISVTPELRALSAEGGTILAARQRLLPENSFEILRIDAEGRTPHEVILSLSPPREEDAPEGELPVICLSCPFVQTADGGFVFRPHTDSDRVARTDPEGRLLWSWSAGREPERYSQEEWIRSRREGHARLFEFINDRSPVGAGPPPPLNLTTLPEPGVRSVLGQKGPLGIDELGRLWTLPAVDRGAPGVVDVFDPHGGYLGAIPVGDGPVAITVRGRWLAVAYEDDLDLVTIRVYRIQG